LGIGPNCIKPADIDIVPGAVAMNVNSTQKLTSAQKACLRLVFLHMSSKDIAKELGLSPHTVDNHIKAAIQRLEAQNRREASRILAEAEGLDVRRTLADQSPELANLTISAPSSASQPLAKQKVEQAVGLDQLPTAKAPGQYSGQSRLPIRLPIPRYLGEENSLSAAERIWWMVMLVIMICLAAGAMLAGLEALAKIV
jgi:DNA-binding CsgD family transcriptional regulator